MKNNSQNCRFSNYDLTKISSFSRKILDRTKTAQDVGMNVVLNLEI